MIREKRDDCMKRVYPVIFTETDNEVLIEVPDMEIMTQANDMYSSIEMARDAIGIKGISMEDDGQIIPEASSARSIDIKKAIFASEGKSVVSLVDVDFVEYRKQIDNKMVRRNVTLPNWLNKEVEKAGINVSKTLQETLMDRLNVSR